MAARRLLFGAAQLATARSLMSAASQRIQATDTPCIVAMQQMLRGKTDVLSLAQGIVHWPPPQEALTAAQAAVMETSTSLYGADDGLPELRAALKEKIKTENGLVNSEIMVMRAITRVLGRPQRSRPQSFKSEPYRDRDCA
eukprot:3827277-Prymnesium_polylepis.1